MPLNTPKTFCMKIENIVKEKNITHMDAVLWYCQKEGLEIEGINPLISKALKEKIEADARELNFLPRQAKLPI
jgi:N-glycosylase/DNA lyase